MSPEELRVTKSIGGVPSLPEQDVVFTKLHNALNGNELRQAIITKVSEALARDQRFSTNLTFPNVAWLWKLDLIVQPSENPNIHVEGMDGYAEVDGEGYVVERDGGIWPRSIYVNVNAGSAPQHPDDVRAETGQAQPRAVRGKDGFPITEVDGRATQVEIPEDYDEYREAQSRDAKRVVAEVKRDKDLRTQQKLQEGQRGRPHKMVEASPLAAGPGMDRFNRPDREPDSQHADPRLTREGTRVKAVRMEPATDPRFKHSPIVGPENAHQALQYDPRESVPESVDESAGVPRARSVSIRKVDGSLSNPEIAQKAADQTGKGAGVVGMGQGEAVDAEPSTVEPPTGADVVDSVLSE